VAVKTIQRADEVVETISKRLDIYDEMQLLWLIVAIRKGGYLLVSLLLVITYWKK